MFLLAPLMSSLSPLFRGVCTGGDMKGCDERFLGEGGTIQIGITYLLISEGSLYK